MQSDGGERREEARGEKEGESRIRRKELGGLRRAGRFGEAWESVRESERKGEEVRGLSDYSTTSYYSSKIYYFTIFGTPPYSRKTPKWSYVYSWLEVYISKAVRMVSLSRV